MAAPAASILQHTIYITLALPQNSLSHTRPAALQIPSPMPPRLCVHAFEGVECLRELAVVLSQCCLKRRLFARIQARLAVRRGPAAALHQCKRVRPAVRGSA